MAFNFTDFLVKNLFDKIKKRNNMFLVKWLDEDTNQNAANNILDVYLMLMFKLKKDSLLLYQTVRFEIIHITCCGEEVFTPYYQNFTNIK